MNRSEWPRLAAALALCLLVLPGCSSRAPRTRYAQAEAPEVAQERQFEHKLAVENYLARMRRLHAVAYPMWTRGSELCAPRTRYRIWAVYSTLSGIDPAYRRAYTELLHVADQPTIIVTTPGSPAEAAGLQAGDVITAIDGAPLPPGTAGIKAALERVNRSQGRPLLFAYRRAGVPGDTVVVPVNSCDDPIAYVEDDELNSESDGRAVLIYSGIMRFTENDDELAGLMAHELAHNVEGHQEATIHNIRNGAIIDAAMGAGGINTHGAFAMRGALRYSQEFESEADYVGLYFAARGGYDLEQTPTFWRRYAAEHPDSIRSDFQSTHPSTPQRFNALEKTIAEIKAKIAAGQPLVPDLKPIPGRTLPAQPEAPTTE